MNRAIPPTLSVRVPFAIRKRGGRKLVITPDGETQRPQPRVDSALVKALARAHRWQRMLESGEYASITGLAEAEKINRSYMCRVLRLTLLDRRGDPGRAAGGGDDAAGAHEGVSGGVGAAARLAGRLSYLDPPNVGISLNSRRSPKDLIEPNGDIRELDWQPPLGHEWSVWIRKAEPDPLARNYRFIYP